MSLVKVYSIRFIVCIIHLISNNVSIKLDIIKIINQQTKVMYAIRFSFL